MSEMNRREFMLATGVAIAAISLPVLQSQAAAPPALPDKPLDVGKLSGFTKDGVTSTFAKRPNYVFIIREDGKLYASSSLCTHKYRPLTVKSDEFFCPAHHSTFTFAGTVTGGPADNSLPRYAIKVDDNGHVMVDFTKEFSESKWDDADSFITVK